MTSFSFTHVDDGSLLVTFDRLLGVERGSTATLVACLAEIDARRLYAPAGYSSMYRFCIDGKGMSEDAAHRRIQAARLARRFPVIFTALADGRLHLSAVLLLREFLTHGNVDELIAAASRMPRRAIEVMLAARYPRPDVPTVIEALTPTPAGARVDERALELPAFAPVDAQAPEVPALAPVDAQAPESPAPARVGISAPKVSQPMMQPRLKPLSAETYALQVTISRGTREKLERLQELLGHVVAPDDLATTIDRAFDLAIHELEHRNHAATDQPRRRGRRASRDPRHIPAHVKRAVRRRDGNQCAFVSDSGQRCSERKGLEYDHVEPVARGGRATISGVRLLCRAHNQYEADRVFGVAFMDGKRLAAAEARESRGLGGACAKPPTAKASCNRTRPGSPSLGHESAVG